MGTFFGALQPMAHTRLLSDKFVEAVRGDDPFQIWNLPAQHGKSNIASRWGPTWALEDDPSTPIILGSYGYTLARENAVFIRDTLVEHGDVLSTRLRRDRRRADRFVTHQQGGVLASGVGGSITGFGARGIVIDDPLKNWQEAHSEARRELVWKWWQSTIRTRLHDRPGRPGWIIVVMTRWHEDDLTGRLLEADESGDGDGWTLVRMPAIAEAPNPKASEWWMRAPDLLGRQVGEALAPLLYDLRALKARARALGSYLTAGMEQQRPAPEEGTEVLRGWWKWYTIPPRKWDDATTSWDMKLKDKESGDFVVGQAWCRTGSDFWMLDQLRGQWNQATTKAAIALLSVRNPRIRRHVIENTGNGPEVMAELRRADDDYVLSETIRSLLGMTDAEVPRVERLIRQGMSGLLPENVKGSKAVRFRAQSPLVEAGNVHVPEDARGESLVNEAAAFPNGSHDDQVDAFSQALKRLSVGTGTATASTGRTLATPAPGQRSTPTGARRPGPRVANVMQGRRPGRPPLSR